MRYLKNIVLTIFVLSAQLLRAQDFPYQYFTHSNAMVNNPSLAAINSQMRADIGTYNLWASGFKPLTDNMVSFSISPDFRKQASRSQYQNRIGLGAVFLNEKTGPFNLNVFQMIYAYHISMDKSTSLSLGICGMIENIRIDVNSLSPLQPDDPRLLNGNDKSFLFDGGFGATLQGGNYQISFSALNLAPGVFRFNKSASAEIPGFRKLFIAGNYSFKISRQFHLQPAITLRNSRQHNFNYDASVASDFNYFALGIGYRSEKSIFAFAQIPYKDFILSYTTENPLSSVHMIGKGHTFSLAWNYGK